MARAGDFLKQVLLCAALIMSGGGCCAAFRAGHLERIRAWPPRPAPEPEKLRSVRLVFDGEGLESGRQVPLDPRSRFLFANATALAYYRSGLFSHVRESGEPADIRVDVWLSQRRTRAPVALRVAHALTLGVVPSWERLDLTMVTTCETQADAPSVRLEKSEAVVIWSHILLFLVYPLAPPPGVTAGCVFDLSRATIAAGVAQGVF